MSSTCVELVLLGIRDLTEPPFQTELVIDSVADTDRSVSVGQEGTSAQNNSVGATCYTLTTDR